MYIKRRVAPFTLALKLVPSVYSLAKPHTSNVVYRKWVSKAIRSVYTATLKRIGNPFETGFEVLVQNRGFRWQYKFILGSKV